MALNSFDPIFYRSFYRDLAHLTSDDAARHYREFGRNEGRVGAAAALREKFIEGLPNQRPVLEVGPFASPLARGENVKYADVLTTAGLRARAVELKLDPDGCPAIDYPLPTLDLDGIPERFGAVLSCHSIEHQPDLVRHVQAVERLLEPGGSYFLVVPDKRYCFDHFLPETSIADVMTAYVRRRKVHEVGSVIEHWALTTHNDAMRHWDGDHGQPRIRENLDALRYALREYQADPDRYIDVHAWHFTPDGFHELFGLIHKLELTSMRPVSVYDTPAHRQEFCAVLTKPDQ